MEICAQRDRALRVPLAHLHPLHDRVERGHLCRRKLLRRSAVQRVFPILSVRLPAARGSHPCQGLGYRVQVPKQHVRVVLHRQEEGRTSHQSGKVL